MNPERAYVALGSNLGDRAAHLRAAIDALRQHPEVEWRALSRVYETAPVGPPGQGPYLNAVSEVATRLPPQALLGVLLEIEAASGRVRGAERNAARTLDLDLLWMQGRCISTPSLELPHPRMRERAFVLMPLADLAPDLDPAGDGRHVSALARAAPGRAGVRVVDIGLP